MKIVSAIGVLFFSLSTSFAQDDAQKRKEAFSSGEYNVSIVRLIATPEKYHNKAVQIIGYLNLEFEGNAIYLHKDDYDNREYKNSFWVSFSNNLDKKEIENCNNSYVILQGIFDMGAHGHRGLFGGEIMRVTSIVKR